jgi:hypothetical protein
MGVITGRTLEEHIVGMCPKLKRMSVIKKLFEIVGFSITISNFIWKKCREIRHTQSLLHLKQNRFDGITWHNNLDVNTKRGNLMT